MGNRQPRRKYGTAYGWTCPKVCRAEVADIMHPDRQHILELMCQSCGEEWAVEASAPPRSAWRNPTGSIR